MAIRIWSAPAAIAIYAITGWLIAQERTRAVLVIQLWMNGLNILLDLWFVLGLDWGVAGVAHCHLHRRMDAGRRWACGSAAVLSRTRTGAIGCRCLTGARWIAWMIKQRDILIRSAVAERSSSSFSFWVRAWAM